LENLETNQPDLPDDVKALLAEARGDIHLALQGKEAENIQENLLTAMDGLIGQIEQYKTEINRIELEEQLDTQLLQEAESDLQGASRKLLDELKRAGELSEERDVIDPLYLEVLNKVALAEQAVDISEDLAQQSRGILEQIIDQRIAQRKARKKAFWNELLGVVSTVIGIVGTIISFTPLAPIGWALNAANAGITAIQAAINGDWTGAIFGAVMGGLNAITAGFGNVLSQGAKTAIQGLTSIAKSAYEGVRSIQSGESIFGFLQILSGVAGAATSWMKPFINKCSSITKKLMVQVFKSLEKAPVQIYKGIKGIEEGDFLAGISNIFNAAISIGQNFAGVFNQTAADFIDYLGSAGKTVLELGKAIDKGGIHSWLNGIGNIAGIWNDKASDIAKFIQCEFCLSDKFHKIFVDTVNVLSKTPQKISKGIQSIEKGEWVDGIGEILKAAISSAKTYAKDTFADPLVNAIENAGYSAIAVSKVIDGATDGLKGLQKGSKKAWEDLKEGWKDDVEKYKLKEHFKAVAKDLKKDIEEIEGYQDIKKADGLKELYNALTNWETYEQMSDGLWNWANSELKPEVKESFLDLLSTLNPNHNRPVRPVSP
ncbi:MAG: hypothetical protein AB4080_22845, partial [Trichodesmium sp.]